MSTPYDPPTNKRRPRAIHFHLREHFTRALVTSTCAALMAGSFAYVAQSGAFGFDVSDTMRVEVHVTPPGDDTSEHSRLERRAHLLPKGWEYVGPVATD